jgi:hypothetical protein
MAMHIIRKATKKVIWAAAVLLAVAIFLIGLPASAADTNQDGDRYTLTDRPGDTPGTARLKASLRLLSAFNQVQTITKECANTEAMKGYIQANGSVLADVIDVIRNGGGQSEEWKNALVTDAERQARQKLKDFSCSRLISDIRAGEWSLHSGRYLADYRLVRGK